MILHHSLDDVSASILALYCDKYLQIEATKRNFFSVTLKAKVQLHREDQDDRKHIHDCLRALSREGGGEENCE